MSFKISMVDVILFVVIATLTWFALLEPPYLSYRNLPFEVLEIKVPRGGVVPLKVSRCNSSRLTQTYTLTRSLQSIDTELSFVLKDSVVQIAPGCTESISLVNHVPPEVKPGKYRIIGLAEVQGTFRTHQVLWHSKEFEVVEL